MAKYEYFVCLVMLVLVSVVAAKRPHHPKFPYKFTERDYRASKSEYTKVSCSGDRGLEREKIIEESRCGKPRDVFVHLEPKAAHEEVSPGAVWVKRCVGLCEFDSAGSCVATETRTRHIPVRIYNAETKRETCATYPVEEHVNCVCCNKEASECASPKIYVPRKCSCQCPNTEERRECLRKRNPNMRWNRSKCICEERRKTHV